MYSDVSLFDQRAKMSTSRKVRAKLAKQRRSARKATSTEAARKEPEPEPTKHSTAETQAATQRGTVTASSALTGTQFVGFATGCRAKNYLQDSVCSLHISEPTPGLSGTQRQTTPGISQGRQPVPQKRSLGAATAGR